MKIGDSLRLAGRSLTGHRLRSALTIVGIVIGISTVIIFASFGTSVQTDVLGEFEDTSASEVLVVTGELAIGDPGEGDINLPQIGEAPEAVTQNDIEQLGELANVEAVIPRGEIQAGEAIHQNSTLPIVSMMATTPAAFGEDEFIAGESFRMGTENEVVLSEDAAEQFDTNVSIGDTVRMNYEGGDEQFTIVGITSSGGGFGNINPTPTIYVPTNPYYDEYGTIRQIPGTEIEQPAYGSVTVRTTPDQVSTVQEDVERYMQDESDARQILNTDVGITVQSVADVVDGIESVLNDIIRLVSGIGLLALLVGAFGIANIMLVSVTERTKEIGIMKANGARNREVMGLFLGEAVMLGIIGAVVGIPIGLAVGYGASAYAEVGFTVPFGWILAAAGMGIATGVVAGLYPAWRAARVDPIDALRYE